ncbi:MAG: hypothetical protein HZA84_01205 [Thaumarchaeota archaeon]|nr:hypothetical protein [Nitrososphaerota archaeon]
MKIVAKKVGNAKKTADLLKQLKKAGATITIVKDDAPKTLDELRKGSRLSNAAIDSIAKGSKVDFTAWAAWTLRF